MCCPERSVWTTREGEEIPIAKMGTSHIENTIKMLERKGFIGYEESCEIVNPFDSATVAFDAWNAEVRETVRVCPQLDSLRSELSRRRKEE